MTTLNLDHIIDVSVSVSPSASPRADFNQLLIIGSSDVIAVSDRLKSFESLAEILEEGFTTADPEYLAAARYFAQSPAPDTVWIGRRDTAPTSPEESFLDAIQACRVKEADWYMVYCAEDTITSDDIEEIALAVESMSPSTVFVFNSSDADILTSVSTDIASTLKALAYKRTMPIYSTSAHIAAGIMGVACGLNDGAANSAFTLNAKTITGSTIDSLTSSQRSIVEGKNCNCYLYYASYYSIFEPGLMSNGYFFDQILNRDMLVNDIQLSCMDLLYGNRKIPQTEAGMTMIENAIQTCCESAVTRGHLGPGSYTGIDFLNLKKGDAMPNGYVIQRDSLADQSAADRAARKSVTFYITVKEAGAVHSMTIEIVVNV